MDFTQFKQECIEACHTRHACKEGYADLLGTHSVTTLLRTVKDYWDDVYRSKYADIVAENIERWFDGQEDEFHKADVFVNETADHGLVFVNNQTETPVIVKGNAKAYVFGASKVKAYDNAEVYCHTAGSMITLRDNAFGRIGSGHVISYNKAKVEIFSDTYCVCYGNSIVTANGGKVLTFGHREINAYLDAVVSFSPNYLDKNIHLFDNACKEKI